MSSIALLCCALITYFVTVFRTRDWVAPSGLLCMFWFAAASLADFAVLKDPTLQHDWEFETYAAVYLSGLSMFTAGLVQVKRRGIQPVHCDPSATFRLATTILMWLSIVAVAARFYISGFSLEILILQFGNADLKSQIPDGIPIVHYFEIFTPFLCLSAIFELKSSRKLGRLRRIGLIGYVVYSIVVYSIILTVSRGTLLVIITGTLYIYARDGHLRFKHLITIAALVIAAMSGFSFLRMSAGFLSNSFLGDEPLMIFLSPIYTYVAFNFENFNSLVRADTDPTYVFYSLKFLLWPVFKSEYESGAIRLIDFDTLFFNARTFLYPFYHDLGLIGCVIYPGIISFFLARLNNYSHKNPGLIILLMALQKSIWFTFFGNYFFGELVIFIPLFAMAILGVLYRPVRRRYLSLKVISNNQVFQGSN